MSAQDALAALAEDGVTLVLKGGRLRAQPSGRMRPETIALVRTHLAELRTVVTEPWADCAAAFQLGRLHQCRACRHFAATIPPGGDRLGLQDAGWCQRYSVATRPLDPFYCRDYTARVH